MTDVGLRCHRCNDPMTLYEVTDRYCPPCQRDIAARESVQPKRPFWFARLRAKDMTARVR